MEDEQIDDHPIQEEEVYEPPKKKKKRLGKSVKEQPQSRETIEIISKMFKKHTKYIEEKLNKLEEEVKKTAEAQKILVSQNKDNTKESTPESNRSDCDKNIIYSITNLNQEKPKFGGINYKTKEGKEIHPVTFLEDLTSYLKKIPSKGNEIDIIQECLTDQARNWARIYKDRWLTYDDFKRDFLDTFWSEVEQNKVRRNIASNKWNRKENPTMLGHFLSLAGQVSLLKLTIPERQLVADIMRHYPRQVQQLWVLSKNETIIAATEFLRQLDNIESTDDSFAKASTSFATTESRENSNEEKRTFRKPNERFIKWKRPVDIDSKRDSGVSAVSKTPGTSATVALIGNETQSDKDKGNM